jgi:hypothetical protein
VRGDIVTPERFEEVKAAVALLEALGWSCEHLELHIDRTESPVVALSLKWEPFHEEKEIL